MNFDFVTLDNIIKHNVLPNLNSGELILLLNSYHELINDIIILFGIQDINSFGKLLLDNNGKDAIGLFLLLLPYINDKKALLNVKNLNELYVTRKEDNTDISKSSPKYLFTNIQYNRCNRNPLSEIKFNMTHISQNLTLLKMTLQTMSNRLYVNWVNVVPLSIKSYNDIVIYKNTSNAIKNSSISEWNFNGLPPSHLFIGTIYETIFHILYDDIVDIKWLLYEFDKNLIIRDTEKSQNIKSLIEILYDGNDQHQNLLYLSQCFNNLQLSDNTNLQIFKSSWERLIEIDNNDFLKAIALAFDRYYNKIKQTTTIDYYQEYNISMELVNGDWDDEEYQKQIKTIDINKILGNLKVIPINIVHNFFYYVIHIFKSTYYYKLLYNPDFALKITNTQISGKNIYNFAKNFVHINHADGNFELLPDHWVMLNKKQRELILDRLNNKTNPDNWFNIRGNLRRVFKNKINVDTKNDEIYNGCFDNLTNILFECLISHGTISSITTAIPIKNANEPSDKLKKYSDNIKQYNDSYYFLNGKKYGDMEFVDTKTNDSKLSNEIHYGTKKYIDYISSNKSVWKLLYAMNWVSQINFFHKYLNNRVIFVTGGTGVGKSSQVPKLLLYALKTCDWKNNGKIICSQPRQRPTSENAINIANQMGVDIKIGEYVRHVDDENMIVHKNNFNIQYQHGNGMYPKKSKITNMIVKEQYPILKIVTDKILLNTITNPLYKVNHVTDNKIIYGRNNLYDIIMVDESHEHNDNMDMILTLMKTVSYINNDCKLIIVSATMESDEPTYRRYYRDINDNKMFPLNQYIKEYNLDRINVDRRLDISVPMETTTKKITDNYSDIDYFDASDDDVNNAILQIINKITQKNKITHVGDILLFRSGQKEISDCVDFLNNNIENTNICAIPYYTNLPSDIKNLVETIGNISSREKIKIDKKKIAHAETLNDFMNGKNSYSNFIIVATNIAEASITIDTLTDVIDDGLQKINIYDPLTNSSKITKTYIAESNRIQRRGRVGRVADGNVYYLYSQNALVNKKNQYKMCISNIMQTLFSLLANYDDIVIIDDTNDPNRMNGNISSSQNMEKYKYDNIFNLGNIIGKQYCLNGNFYDYVGDPKQYDYQNSVHIQKKFINGETYQTLEDVNGEYYIVHPDENIIDRNIVGKIVNDYHSSKINNYFERLLTFMVVIMKYDDNKKIFVGSPYGKFIRKISTQEIFLKYDISHVITCYFAREYGCLDEYIKYLVTSANKFDNLIIDNDCSSDITRYIKLYDTNYRKNDHLKHMFDELKMNIDNAFVTTNIIDKFVDVEPHKLLLSKNDLLTLSLLHGFGNNLVVSIIGTNKYINIKYPYCETIKIIKGDVSDEYKNKFAKKQTHVIDKYLYNYLIYIQSDVSQYDPMPTISTIHYVNPKLLSFISYQFPITYYCDKFMECRKLIYQKCEPSMTEKIMKTMKRTLIEIDEANKNDRFRCNIFIPPKNTETFDVNKFMNDYLKCEKKITRSKLII